MGFGTFSLNETGSSSRSMQIFLFRSPLMQPRVRVLERVYFIHAAHTVHSIRAVIKFYFRQLCVYAFHGSLWKYAGNSCNNTQTHANAPLYSLPPPPPPRSPSSHANASTFRTSRAIRNISKPAKKKIYAIFRSTSTIDKFPSLFIPRCCSTEIFVSMETIYIYIYISSEGTLTGS